MRENETVNESARTQAKPATEAAVYRAVDRLNEMMAETQQVPKSHATLLFAEGTTLDSLALVNLLVFVEDEIRESFGRELILAGEDDDRPLPKESLETLGGLIDGVQQLLSVQT